MTTKPRLLIEFAMCAALIVVGTLFVAMLP